MKGGLEFYRRIFARSGIEPERAVVIDDNPAMLELAGSFGARTIQSRVLNRIISGFLQYTDPAELPELVDSLD